MALTCRLRKASAGIYHVVFLAAVASAAFPEGGEQFRIQWHFYGHMLCECQARVRLSVCNCSSVQALGGTMFTERPTIQQPLPPPFSKARPSLAKMSFCSHCEEVSNFVVLKMTVGTLKPTTLLLLVARVSYCCPAQSLVKSGPIMQT